MKDKLRYSAYELDKTHPFYLDFKAAVLDGVVAIAYCFTMKFAQELAYSLNLKEHAEKTNWQNATQVEIVEQTLENENVKG